jgi:HD superfamily phosphodiesterase
VWNEKLAEFVLKLEHPAWGHHHAMRVHAMSLELAHAENTIVDEESLFAAACLHDIGTFEEYRAEEVDHAERSADLSPEILKGFGFPDDRIPLVCDIIRELPRTLQSTQAQKIGVIRKREMVEFIETLSEQTLEMLHL